ncbi:ABC transporter substrate-binding protein [Aneurinibacillus migulanus]|uniref:ABC transporter substrate-binding protein n=1 Tax=Aneurinibacillus migulanus TaxID=47500 RepID=UPI00209ECFE5|nr:ABC transporter substrate-binding protein [Aneurinibacillus migulanus]MCP1357706.1 ABC transporter substrate-binding protein [Aneurinibacillus migulanus]
MKLFFRMVLFFILALVFIGCGQQGATSTAGSQGDASKRTEAVEPKEEGFRTVSTQKGEVKIPANPKRVVELANSTEELLIMGIKPVMSSALSNGKIPPYLEGKLDGVNVVNANSVKVEDILAMKPDLILLSARTEKLYEQASKIAPTIQLQGDFYTWRERFPELAAIFGKEKEMKEWMAQYEAKAKKIGDEIKAKTGSETFALYVSNQSHYRIYGKALIGDVLFTDLGLPMAEGTPTKTTVEQVSLESLYKYNPAHIFLGYYAGGGGNTQANLEIAKKKNADLQSSELFKKLKAYETGNVYSLEYATWSLGTYPLGKEQALEKIRDIILKK